MGSSVGENTPKKKNVAAFAAGERACASSSSDNERKRETTLENVDNLRSCLNRFDGLNLDDKVDIIPDERKDELILMFTQTVKGLEGKVHERKEWAQQTAIQAARKLSKDITELNILRMERFEPEDISMCKPSVSTMERIKKIENALEKAGVQKDQALGTEKLEKANAELRAEIEASKLSTSESLAACLELAKRENRSLKKQQAWEKQKTRLQEELAVERAKNSEKEQLLVNIGVALRELEVKGDEERRAKDLALSQVQTEHRLKKATGAKSRKKIEKLRKKMPIDFQRHEDNLQTLKEELSKLKASNNRVSTVNAAEVTQGKAMDRMYPELDNLDASVARGCLFCMRAELPVVFLPCAHAVLCSHCNDMNENIGETKCPDCQVPIERRILFFDASS